MLRPILLVSVLLSGCTSFGQALVPQLKPIDAGIQFQTKCSDLIAKGNSDGQMTPAQLVALYSACEAMQAEQRVIIDPQAARKAINPLP